MKRLAGLLLLFAIQALQPGSAFAHEMRPAYLEMREVAPGRFDVKWKVPALGDMRLGLYAELPATCGTLSEPRRTLEANEYLERWSVVCRDGLKGKTISVEGLRATLTDVLVRIAYANGAMEVARLRPDQPAFVVAGPQTSIEIALTYLRLGVEHILFGVDHLLFVLALMLLIRDRWMLLKTVTAFTIAHSITLAGAALGYFSLPQKPVEATIALSIAFVASELAKMGSGERRLSEARPWLVAFSFGLLHGFGFAGALKEIGLPQVDVPLALVTFNLGVEAGQVLFVGAVLAVYRLAAMAITLPVARARPIAAYVIGTVAAFWLVERVVAFMS